MIDRGYLAPWMAASQRQNEIVVSAAAAAAGCLARGGYTVVFDGVIGPWFLEAFGAATGLAEVRYVLLLPPPDVCIERVRRRAGHGFTDLDATRHMYQEFVDAPRRRSIRPEEFRTRRRDRCRDLWPRPRRLTHVAGPDVQADRAKAMSTTNGSMTSANRTACTKRTGSLDHATARRRTQPRLTTAASQTRSTTGRGGGRYRRLNPNAHCDGGGGPGSAFLNAVVGLPLCASLVSEFG